MMMRKKKTKPVKATTTGKNPNHPAKGSQTKVSPIRSLEDIAKIKRNLAYNPKYLLLFTMGVNSGIRTGDLLKLKVKDVKGKSLGDILTIKESKTGKDNTILINQPIHDALQTYFDAYITKAADFLFQADKRENAMTTAWTNRLVKSWCREIGLTKENYGAHTLRKTFGYIQRTIFNTSWEVLATRFNHSHPRITMAYLGITDAEIEEILQHAI